MSKTEKYTLNAFGYLGLICSVILVLINAACHITADNIIEFGFNYPLAFIACVGFTVGGIWWGIIYLIEKK